MRLTVRHGRAHGADEGGSRRRGVLLEEERAGRCREAGADAEHQYVPRLHLRQRVVPAQQQRAYGFLDRNARNAHQYLCKFNNSPGGIGVAVPPPRPTESVFPALFGLLGGLDFDLPVDGQRSLTESRS